MAMLRQILQESANLRPTQLQPPIGSELILQQLPTIESLSLVSWPEVMRAVLLLLPPSEADPPAEALAALREAEYVSLRPRHKLQLLRALGDAWLSCPHGQRVLQQESFREVNIDQRHEARANERAARWRASN